MGVRRPAPEGIHPAKRKRPPMQPVVLAKDACVRFQANRLVLHLLDHGGIDLNDLAEIEFPRSDREQFAQLIGYSLSGFSELGYVRNETFERAEAKQRALEFRMANVEDDAAILKARALGLSIRAIAARLKLDRNHVARVLWAKGFRGRAPRHRPLSREEQELADGMGRR